jgi:lipoate-protein ligase A
MTTATHRYPRATWRLLFEDLPRSGAENMAADEAIMDAVAAGDTPPTLRLYHWAPPSLSLGKRQPLSSVLFDRCASDGVQVVRRATGGLAILHTDELTYSIATQPDDPRAAGAILDAYRSLSEGLMAALAFLGVQPEMEPVSPGASHTASAVCFEQPSAYEISVAGRKLIGSAQVRPQGRVLQHGSLPLTGDIGRIVDYLCFESDSEREALRRHLRERATTLSAVLKRDVPYAEAADALRRGFADALNLDLEPGTMTDAERTATERLVQAKRVEVQPEMPVS